MEMYLAREPQNFPSNRPEGISEIDMCIAILQLAGIKAVVDYDLGSPPHPYWIIDKRAWAPSFRQRNRKPMWAIRLSPTGAIAALWIYNKAKDELEEVESYFENYCEKVSA